jgi:hypothetical protein
MRHAAILITLATLLPASRCGTDSPPVITLFSPSAPGSITGTARLYGVLKPDRRMGWGIPTCGGKPIDLSKLDTIPLGKGQSMGNVYVAVKSGLGDRRFPTPGEPVLLRQVGCVYEPRVLGIMTNQLLRIRNYDDTMHNVDITPSINPMFGRGQRAKGEDETFTFSKSELAIPIKCNIHPWMRAWLHVSEHPYFAVTAADGAYSIPGLPPGEYEILAWHERFLKAPLISNVKVESGKTSTLDFTFELPRK